MAEDPNSDAPESDFAILCPGHFGETLWQRHPSAARRLGMTCRARDSKIWRDVTIKKSGERLLGQEQPRFVGAGAMPCGPLRLGCLIVAAILVVAWGSSAKAASFDGTWFVLQACDSAQLGPRGYPWLYEAMVKGGHLVGHYRNKGQNLSMLLEGEINSDGTATLNYTESPTPAQSPMSFRVIAKFEVASGTGNRLGMRSCKFAFTRQ